MAERRLLVSVHDVTPAHDTRLARVFALLDEFAVRRVALLVVPDWHGGWPLGRFESFAAMLRDRVAAGAEVLLHGYRHDEHGGSRTLRQQVVTFGRTDREAEFLLLGREEAARRIDAGLAVLRGAALDPVGFVPPAWFHGPGLRDILAARGLRVSEDAWSVIDVPSGRRIRAPAVQWSARTAWRRAAGVAIAAARVPLERRRRVLRLVVHPPDVGHPGLADSVRRSLDALLAKRRPVSYRDVVTA